MWNNPASKEARQMLESSKIQPDLSSPIENRRAVASAFGKEIRAPEVCFVHGTSLAVLNHALKTGFVPGGLEKQPDGSSAFYIFNVPSKYPYTAPSGGCTLPEDDATAIKHAEKYAGCISAHFDSVRALRDQLAASNGEEPPIFDERLALVTRNPLLFLKTFENEGLDPVVAERIERLFTSFSTHNKILLGFSHSLATDYGLNEAADQDEGLWVRVDKGIPLKYLVSIEPLSDHADEFGSKIQESVELAQADPLEGLTFPKF